MRISDWSSDVCSSDLVVPVHGEIQLRRRRPHHARRPGCAGFRLQRHVAAPVQLETLAGEIAVFERDVRLFGGAAVVVDAAAVDGTLAGVQVVQLRRAECGAVGSADRSEEHTSELQSLMRISYAVFCLKKKKQCTLTIMIDV